MRKSPYCNKLNEFKYKKIKIILSLIITFLLVISPMSFFVKAADTIIVDDDGTADYSTIQGAINAANDGQAGPTRRQKRILSTRDSVKGPAVD